MQKECVLIDRSNVCDGDDRIVFVKFEFQTEGCCSSLKDYYRAANQIGISRTEDCKMHEHRVYASREFDAERRALNSFVVMRDKGIDEKDVRVARILVLCHCFVKRDIEAWSWHSCNTWSTRRLCMPWMRHRDVYVCDG